MIYITESNKQRERKMRNIETGGEREGRERNRWRGGGLTSNSKLSTAALVAVFIAVLTGWGVSRSFILRIASSFRISSTSQRNS